jgi:hypothetical protein
LEQFGRRYLQLSDKVALETTINTWEVVGILKPFVAEVVVSNPLKTKASAEAKIKTDKVDAEVLAQLLRYDFLPRVWDPPVATQALRRLTARRATLVDGQDRDQESHPRGVTPAPHSLSVYGSLWGPGAAMAPDALLR